MTKAEPKAVDPKKRPLTDQEAAFARAYVSDPAQNAAAAARAAGYAAAGARVRACELLRRPHVAAYIEHALKRAAQRVARAKAKAVEPEPEAAPARLEPAKRNTRRPRNSDDRRAPLGRNVVTPEGDLPPVTVEPLPFILNLDAVIREVALMGFANMADFIQIDDSGLACVDLKNLTRDQAAAIKEITVEEFKEGRGKGAPTILRTKIKLADKLPALIALGKQFGGFRENVDVDAAAGGPLAEFIAQIRGITRSALPVAPADWSDAEVVVE